MTKYTWMYRLGLTPWERHGTAAAASIGALLDREEAGRRGPPGRALDLGCGRGQFTPELARRGWRAVGIDVVPQAIAAARKRADGDGVEYVVGDVADLGASGLGSFDFFFDKGCFQGLAPDQRAGEGRGVTLCANPGATLLLLAFGPSRWQRLVEGVSQSEVESAFREWELLAVDEADTTGLGFPMNQTAPRWYRFQLR